MISVFFYCFDLLSYCHSCLRFSSFVVLYLPPLASVFLINDYVAGVFFPPSLSLSLGVFFLSRFTSRICVCHYMPWWDAQNTESPWFHRYILSYTVYCLSFVCLQFFEWFLLFIHAGRFLLFSDHNRALFVNRMQHNWLAIYSKQIELNEIRKLLS